MKEMVDVLGFGHCCIDHLAVLDPFPEKGMKGDVAESLVIAGGPVPIALSTAARFRCSAQYFGKVGDDADGDQIRRELHEDGVDVSRMIIDSNCKTARAYIWIDKNDGSRSIALDYRKTNWLSEKDVDLELIEGCKLFLCDNRSAEATLKALHYAKEAGVITMIDAGSVRPGFREMLKLVDYTIVSQDLKNTLLKGIDARELAEMLVRMGTGTAVVTCGAEGSVYCNGAETRHIPGFLLDAVDTTGAGDIFHGAFIYGLLENWELTRIVRFSNAAAALSCRRLSGRLGIPKLHEVEELVKIS
jgi:ribokinase